jgi:hypothetical protein
MTLSQRLALANSIETCADWVWPETNPGRVGQWAVDNPGNNYFHGFMLTWMAGLTLSGESAKAQGYIDNARHRWDTVVAPYLQGPASGGLWAEGSNYGTESTGFILYNLIAHQTATGEDLISSNPWFTDAVSAMIQTTNPPMTEMAPFGDIGAGPVNDWHRRVMLEMASHDSRCKPWLDGTTPSKMMQRLNAFLDFMWYPG